MLGSGKPKPARARRTRDGLAILNARYLKGDPAMARMVEEQQTNMEIASRICSLREKAGLSQRALAKLVGTTASVICRLEDADYEGHSLAMLRRIATALGRRVQIRFLPRKTAS
jgi:ribosome-binding protein aMBF1 (putative translation factor)